MEMHNVPLRGVKVDPLAHELATSEGNRPLLRAGWWAIQALLWLERGQQNWARLSRRSRFFSHPIRLKSQRSQRESTRL